MEPAELSRRAPAWLWHGRRRGTGRLLAPKRGQGFAPVPNLKLPLPRASVRVDVAGQKGSRALAPLGKPGKNCSGNTVKHLAVRFVL